MDIKFENGIRVRESDNKNLIEIAIMDGDIETNTFIITECRFKSNRGDVLLKRLESQTKENEDFESCPDVEVRNILNALEIEYLVYGDSVEEE